MDESRRTSRLLCDEKKGIIVERDNRLEVDILDISTGGMRISMFHPLGLGARVYGEFRILPYMGPFFVKGKVTREAQENGTWEAAVQFEKVSTIPLC